jgi:MFS family permease
VNQNLEKATGWALLWNYLLSEPLYTLYGFVGFILYRDLGASAFAIALLTTAKPVVTILSFYWSSGLKGRASRLKANVLWAGFWMRAPFLLCPWIGEAWYLIAASVNYMFFYRAASPAWNEILRRNVGEEKRGRWFSIVSGIGYAESVVIALGVGGWLDREPGLWKLFFFGASLIGMASLAILSWIEVEADDEEGVTVSLTERIKEPWKNLVCLMRDKPDFSLFQWGLMLWGLGLMVIQPALPIFAVDFLGISYMEMAAAVSVAKGIGFALSSPFWGKFMEGRSILQVSCVVFGLMGCFPILLCFAGVEIAWLYVAYFWYGVGQAGGHLVWNLSGPIFAGKEESHRYTGVNVAMAGMRGLVGPSVGGILTVIWGPVQVLVLGAFFCFCSGSLLWSRMGKKNPFVRIE